MSQWSGSQVAERCCSGPELELELELEPKPAEKPRQPGPARYVPTPSLKSNKEQSSGDKTQHSFLSIILFSKPVIPFLDILDEGGEYLTITKWPGYTVKMAQMNTKHPSVVLLQV